MLVRIPQAIPALQPVAGFALDVQAPRVLLERAGKVTCWW